MSNERERIEQILHRYDEIIASMADPAIVSDGARYLKLTKELSDIEPVVTRIRDKDRVEKNLPRRGSFTPQRTTKRCGRWRPRKSAASKRNWKR